jgi:hypothetical protein
LWRQRKGKWQKNDIQVLVHWLLLSGVSYYDNRERVFMFDFDTKEKEHQHTLQSDKYSGATPPRTCTNQIASCFDAPSITKKLNSIRYFFWKLMLLDR